MAEQEFFSINPSTHIRTTSENRPFYDLLVDEKHIFSTKYQLYTFAIMVALRAGVAPDSATKSLDICLVGNVDKDIFNGTRSKWLQRVLVSTFYVCNN